MSVQDWPWADFLPQQPGSDPSSERVIERRSKLRFPLDLQVRYHTLCGRRIAGEGRTVNLSSRGILVTRAHELRENTKVELRIQWPSLLESKISLQLVVSGTVVRGGPSSFAVAVDQHQFRTARNENPRPPDQPFVHSGRRG